jgi:hypothetical protein
MKAAWWSLDVNGEGSEDGHCIAAQVAMRMIHWICLWYCTTAVTEFYIINQPIKNRETTRPCWNPKLIGLADIFSPVFKSFQAEACLACQSSSDEVSQLYSKGMNGLCKLLMLCSLIPQKLQWGFGAGAQRSCNGARRLRKAIWHRSVVFFCNYSWHERYQMEIRGTKGNGFSDVRLGWRELEWLFRSGGTLMAM